MRPGAPLPTHLRTRRGARPNVDVERPDVRVNVYLHRDQATVSIDLSGTSQHRRGYRAKSAPAPLKENLAAAVLLLADWPRRVGRTIARSEDRHATVHSPG